MYGMKAGGLESTITEKMVDAHFPGNALRPKIFKANRCPFKGRLKPGVRLVHLIH